MSSQIIPCPHCGKQIYQTLVKAGGAPGVAGGFTPVTRSNLNTAIKAPWSVGAPTDYAGVDYERKAPAREPSLQGDVAVPLAQSVLTGIALGVPVASGLGLLGYELGQCLTAGAVAAVVGISGTWFTKLGLHHDLLWAVEKITGRDIDGDDEVGEPEPKPEPEPFRVELAQGRQTRIVDLPATDAQLCAIAQSVLSGGTFARRELSDILTADEYKALAAAMLAGGLLAAKGKTTNAGVELTYAGRAVLRRLVVVGGGGDDFFTKNTDKTIAGQGGAE